MEPPCIKGCPNATTLSPNLAVAVPVAAMLKSPVARSTLTALPGLMSLSVMVGSWGSRAPAGPGANARPMSLNLSARNAAAREEKPTSDTGETKGIIRGAPDEVLMTPLGVSEGTAHDGALK